MKIEVGPTGNLIKGDVLDVSVRGLTEALQFYDPLLYLKWEPKKRDGQGMWTLRRKPEFKVLTYHGEFEGKQLYTLEYKEMDLENHVFNLPSLNYKLLDRVRKADVWVRADYDRSNQRKVQAWTKKLDEDEELYKTEMEQKIHKEAMYNMMQHRSALKEYKEAILSGTNPAHLARYWGQK